MKRIINGKRYDTETAELIAEHSHLYAGDLGRFEEALYRTKNGAWFLAGEGGPASKYARHEGNESLSSKGLRVLTPEHAQAWLEARGELEALERFFHVEDA